MLIEKVSVYLINFDFFADSDTIITYSFFYTFLQQRAEQCIRTGINKNKIIIDPGFGFGKTLAHNISLFKGIKELQALDYPVLIGASRKSMLGQITGKAIEDRLAGSLALASLAAINGASIIRVHDVAETVDAVKVVQALIF